MSVQLLDKTRKINKLLHNNHSLRVEFSDICDVLSGILESNILVISKKEKFSEQVFIPELMSLMNLYMIKLVDL